MLNSCAKTLAGAHAADEFFHGTVRFVVGHLHGRMLGKISGRGMKDATDAAIESEFAASDRVDRNSGGVWGIFHGEFQVELHRDVAKESALDADKTDFVVQLPRDVIARPDVDIFIVETLAHDRLHGFSLGGFLRSKPIAIEHVEKIGVSAGV